MRRSFVLFLLFAAIGIAADTLPGTNAALSREGQIIDFVRRYDRAWNRKEVDAVKRMLANDYVYFTSKGGIYTREQTLDLLQSPGYILDSAERIEIQLHHTGRTAIVSSRWRGHGSYNGEEFRDDQRCSIVLARAGQTWMVLAEHCTQIVSP